MQSPLLSKKNSTPRLCPLLPLLTSESDAYLPHPYSTHLVLCHDLERTLEMLPSHIVVICPSPESFEHSHEMLRRVMICSPPKHDSTFCKFLPDSIRLRRRALINCLRNMLFIPSLLLCFNQLPSNLPISVGQRIVFCGPFLCPSARS